MEHMPKIGDRVEVYSRWGMYHGEVESIYPWYDDSLTRVVDSEMDCVEVRVDNPDGSFPYNSGTIAATVSNVEIVG